jgi:hypothetical protein
MSQINIALDLSLIAVNLNMLRNTQLRVRESHLFIFLNFKFGFRMTPVLACFCCLLLCFG